MPFGAIILSGNMQRLFCLCSISKDVAKMLFPDDIHVQCTRNAEGLFWRYFALRANVQQVCLMQCYPNLFCFVSIAFSAKPSLQQNKGIPANKLCGRRWQPFNAVVAAFQ